MWLGVALLLQATLIVGVLVFGSSGETEERSVFLSAEGLVTEVEPDRVRMHLSRPIDGHEELDFIVQPGDRAELDIPHLRSHARDRVPTRIYYKREGDNYVARDSADLPLR